MKRLKKIQILSFFALTRVLYLYLQQGIIEIKELAERIEKQVSYRIDQQEEEIKRIRDRLRPGLHGYYSYPIYNYESASI